MKRLLAGALLSAGVLGGVAAPASAAPPQVFEYAEECFTDTYGGDEFTYCFSGTSTAKFREKSGDTYSGMFRSTTQSSFYVNGVLEETSVSTNRSSFKVREGVETKYFSRFRGTSTFDGQECTYSGTFKIIKGVVKAESFTSDCDFGEI